MTRISALLGKELADLRLNPGLFLPAALTGFVSILLPFFVAIIVPAFAGERLSDSGDFQVAVKLYQDQPALRDLNPEGAIQAWIFQQFLILLVLTPVAGAMSIAAYSVIGEKQARTLEPLLATPLTTFELLAAKVLGAFVPAVSLAVSCFLVYFCGVALLAQPGVYQALLRPSPLAIVFVLGPLASLLALQLAVCVSTRVNDVRSAQQIGALVVLPVAGLLVMQLTGSFQLTPSVIAGLAAALVAANGVLMTIAMVLFDRESILTRSK